MDTMEVECAGLEAEAMSVSGEHRADLEMMTDPLGYHPDAFGIIMSFLDEDAYLFIASISTRWREAWGQRPSVTNPRWAVQSCSCFDWARACGLEVWDSPCLLAAAEGRLDVLQHAVALGYAPKGMPICEHAAGGGQIEVMKWCRANGYPWGRSCLRAAEGGHLEVLKWSLANGCPLELGRFRGSGAGIGILIAGARGGHLDTVKWCREQGYPWSVEACHVAAKGGHLGLLRWLRSNGCPWSATTMDGAASAGSIEMLEWCRAGGCPWSSRVFLAAAQHGNLDVLKWCVANGQQGDMLDMLCHRAAKHGHLDIVQWLRGNGYPWGRYCCYAAASNGHFEVLKWCVQNGCPWDCTVSRSTILEADVFKSGVPMMVWAMENGCPWMHVESDFDRICQHAAAWGNLDILQWCETLYSLHTPLVSREAASNGHVHVLEWLRVSGKLSDGSTLRWLRATNSLSSSGTDAHLWEISVTAGFPGVENWCSANHYHDD